MDFKEIAGYKVSKCGVILGRRGLPLTPHDNGRGYLIVKVFINNKWTSKAVHRFIAEAWIDNPTNLPEINHIDCNRYNNSIENLEWCTHSYNIEYSYSSKNRSALGTNNARCITSEHEVIKICELLSKGLTAAKIRDLGFSYNLIRKIKNRQNWNHISVNYSW